MSHGSECGVLSQTHLGSDAKPYFLHQGDGATHRPSCAKAEGLRVCRRHCADCLPLQTRQNRHQHRCKRTCLQLCSTALATHSLYKLNFSVNFCSKKECSCLKMKMQHIKLFMGNTGLGELAFSWGFTVSQNYGTYTVHNYFLGLTQD